MGFKSFSHFKQFSSYGEPSATPFLFNYPLFCEFISLGFLMGTFLVQPFLPPGAQEVCRYRVYAPCLTLSAL